MLAEERANGNNQTSAHVYRELEQDKALNIAVKRASPQDRLVNAGKRVVENGDIAGLLGHSGAIAHRHAHLSRIESRSIIGSVSGDRHHFALLLEQAHQSGLVIRTCPRHDLDGGSTFGSLVIGKSGKIRSSNDGIGSILIGPQAHLATYLTCSCSRIASDNLYLDARIAAILDSCRHIGSHGVADGHNTQQGES